MTTPSHPAEDSAELLPVATPVRTRAALRALLRPDRGLALTGIGVLVAATAVGLLVQPLLGRIVDIVADGRPAGDLTTEAVLAPYLRGQAAEFLRSLRLHHEHSAPADSGGHDATAATRALRRSARRISGSLHTFRAALDPLWADQLRAELAWLSGILAREHAYANRLTDRKSVV